MTKRETLEEIDRVLAEKILAALNEGDTEMLSDLGPAITFLKNNQVITPPKAEDTIKDKIAHVLK